MEQLISNGKISSTGRATEVQIEQLVHVEELIQREQQESQKQTKLDLLQEQGALEQFLQKK
jgi:hypothetical protein